jgi:putative hydrolase of the HAD superfamily
MSQVLVDAGVGSAGVLPPGGRAQTPGWPVLEAGYDAAWLGWNDAWRANRQLSGIDAAHSICDAVERAFPGASAVAGLRERLLDAFTGQGEGADLMLIDGVADTLAALSERGIRLGIICDVGFTPSPVLLRHLERHGLLEYFDHWSFSDEVGCYKPDRAIFQHALAGLGARAETTAHVGDLRRTDVAGALAMGMTAVRYTGVFDDDPANGPDAHHTIADHRDLPAVLGVVPH